MNMCYHIFITEKYFCFREFAKVVQIAKETDCEIKFFSKGKEGTSKNMLSLVKLMVKPGDVVTCVIYGENEAEVFRRVKVLVKSEKDI